MEIRIEKVAVTTTGSAGGATGSAESGPLHGFLLDIYLDYHASAPNTTDIVVSHIQPSLGNILTVTSANTDGRFPVRDTAVLVASGAVTDPDGYDRIPLSGKLNFAVAEANALDPCVTATIRYLAF